MSLLDTELVKLAEQLGSRLVQADMMLAVAESCTGGLIAAALTEIAGSSAWFDRAFITYSNEAKQQMLNVNLDTLEQYGAVSYETAVEMVSGVLAHSNADWAIAVTGIAGPGGGTDAKPVGTVFIGWGMRGQQVYCERYLFQGDRHSIRCQTVARAMSYLLEVIV